MKGTEKQVAWAKNIIEMIGDIFQSAEDMQSGHPMIEQVKMTHENILNNMKNSDATNIIDDFKVITKCGDVMEDYRSVINILSICEIMKGRKYR